MFAPPSCPTMLPAMMTPAGQSMVRRPVACVAVCELTVSCRLPHCDRLPGSVMRAPTPLLDVQGPTSESDGLLVFALVRTGVAEGVVGMSTVVWRSELHAAATKAEATSVR